MTNILDTHNNLATPANPVANVARRPAQVLHKYGLLQSTALSDAAKKSFGADVDSHAIRLTDVLNAHKCDHDDLVKDQNLSPTGRFNGKKLLADKSAAKINEISDGAADQLRQAQGKLQKQIPTEPPKPLPNDVGGHLEAREIRDNLRGLDPNTRLARALSAARSGHTATVAAIVNDPAHGANLLSDGGIASIKKAWLQGAYPTEHENLSAATEALGVLESNRKTALKALPAV